MPLGGKFMFSYKAERAGRMVVDPKWGDLTKTFRMGVRQGTIIAACRILSLGLGRPKVTPVEMGPSTLRPGFRWWSRGKSRH